MEIIGIRPYFKCDLMNSEKINDENGIKLLKIVEDVKWDFSDNYRRKIVYDFLRALKSKSKANFMDRLYTLLNSQKVSGDQAEKITALFTNDEEDRFINLGYTFVGGLLSIEL